VVTATVGIVQCYSVKCGVIVVKATAVIVLCYCVVSEVIVVTATVDLVQWYCVVCEVYYGYSNSSNRAMLLRVVWSILCLEKQ